jgi:CDP-glycerol glycerophosphotransferase (TagB/SpsB family)
MNITNNYDIDFCWASQKEYFSLKPLYLESQKMGLKTRLLKIHKNRIRNYFKFSNLSKNIVISHDKALKRVRKLGWNGSYIYVEHGLGAMKYYTYKYSFFHESNLLFYPGEIFKKKMESINPAFKNGLLGGYPKMDELYSLKIDKRKLAIKYGLNPDKPIKLFAPSWGGKYSNNFGINNINFFNKIDNLLVVPHPADYKIARKYNVVIPDKDENINQFIYLSDVIISEVSSVLAEACLLNKPVIQLILNQFPGCFPEKDKSKNEDWINKNILEKEIKFNRTKRPFKIPYLDEDWVLGHTCLPKDIEKVVSLVLKETVKYEENRIYWAKQSCYKFDGNISNRIMRMIDEYIRSGKRIQL